MKSIAVQEWIGQVIKPEQNEKFIFNGKTFIDEAYIKYSFR